MSGTSSSSTPTFPPSRLQSEVLERVQALARSSVRSEASFLPALSGEAAIRELLKGSSEYQGLPSTLASFMGERVSLPEDLHDSPQILDLLPQDARRHLEAPERMLRETPEDCTIVPYWDPVLRGSLKEYRKFIQKLYRIGFLDLTLVPAERAGAFFVKKSDGVKQRLIIDGRRANARLVDPPAVRLCTPEAFARIEIEIDPGSGMDFEALINGVGLHVGLSDVKDCFHRMIQPRWLGKFFCLDPIPLKWVMRDGGEVDGQWVHPEQLVFPFPRPLCMGCSWSLYFAQSANENLIATIPRLAHSRLVNDRSDPVVIQANLEENQAGVSGDYHYVYVDNLGLMSTDRRYVSESLKEVENTFNARGLLLHPGEVMFGQAEALGCRLDMQARSTQVKPDRALRIRKALDGLLTRGRSTGRLLEVVIGHLTYAFLVNRPLLSIFHHCYRFVRRHYLEKAKLWPSVIEELKAARGALIFCRSDWWRQWNDLISASDASLEGYGVCTCKAPKAAVSAVGRLSERERFKRRAGHSARESALEALHADLESHSEVDDELLASAGWAASREFAEVPASLLRKDLWDVKRAGRWRFQEGEGIYELESRALLMSLERVVCSRHGRDMRQLLLVDNMAVSLAFERCRSRHFGVLKVIRKFGAYCLGRNVSTSVRWVPSEANAADGPSRAAPRFEKEAAESEANSKVSGKEERPTAGKACAAACAPLEEGPEGRIARGHSGDASIKKNGAPSDGKTATTGPGHQANKREYVLIHDRVRGPCRSQTKAASGGKACAPPAPKVLRGTGSGSSEREHLPRGAGRHSEGPGLLPKRGGGFQGLREAAPTKPRNQQRCGCGHGDVPQRHVLGGGATAQRRQVVGGFPACQPRVWQAWQPEAAQVLERSQGMASSVSRPQSKTVPAGCVGRGGGRAAKARVHPQWRSQAMRGRPSCFGAQCTR